PCPRAGRPSGRGGRGGRQSRRRRRTAASSSGRPATRSSRRDAWEDEALQWLELVVELVAQALELVDLGLRDAQPLVLLGERNRDVRAGVEQLVLDALERGADAVGKRRGEREAELRLHLVDDAVRDDARIGLRDTSPV